MNKDDVLFYKNTFLFTGLSDDEALTALQKITPVIKTFEKGECIYTQSIYERKVGFVIDGCCEVKRVHSDGTTLPLNSIMRYGSFGIVAVLSESSEYLSCVISKNKSSVAFINRDDLFLLIREHPCIALNVAKFLANRIVFLNDKVHTFSGTSVEKKLSNFLISRMKSTGLLEFELNRKRTAELISTGRASLYRALDALRDEGYITYDSKKIYINDPKGLERNSQ